MKKLFLSILVLGLLICNVSFAVDLKKLKEDREKEKLKKKELTLEKITNDFLKNKTVTDLKLLKFTHLIKSNTTTEDSVQYYLYKSFENGSVHVICFVDPKKTICRLP